MHSLHSEDIQSSHGIDLFINLLLHYKCRKLSLGGNAYADRWMRTENSACMRLTRRERRQNILIRIYFGAADVSCTGFSALFHLDPPRRSLEMLCFLVSGAGAHHQVCQTPRFIGQTPLKLEEQR